MRENRYYRFAKVPEETFTQILDSFCQDFSARDAARRSGLSVRSANAIYGRIRARILETCFLDPVAFRGSMTNLRAALERRGYDTTVVEKDDRPMLYEIARCIPSELMHRLSSRGVRPHYFTGHAVELYVKRKCDVDHKPYFLSGFEKNYPLLIVEAVTRLKLGHIAEFRKALNLVPPPPLRSNTDVYPYASLYEELIARLAVSPI